MLVLIYVDDLIFRSNNPDNLNPIVTAFLNIIEGTDMGGVSWYLGVIDCTKSSVSLSQTACIDELVAEYDLQTKRPLNTPMTANSYDELEA